MISRRNIRIKVMQLLYAIEVSKPEKALPKDMDPTKQLLKKINQSRSLFVFLLYYIFEVARYAEINAKSRASKHIVTQDDLNVNIKIAGNEILWKILENEGFRQVVEEERIKSLVEGDFVKKLFSKLIESPVYKEYISIQQRDKKSEAQILLFIFTDLLLANESFQSKLEELYPNWEDDCEVAEQMVMQYINKPQTLQLKEAISLDKWEYAKLLLKTVEEKESYLMELIKPKLNNWDSERIAIVDLILLKMGVSELLYFETIPTKVTINEYIDIAKEYSTKLSGQFVNGILDSIHKDLISQNKIQKVDFKRK